MGWNQFKSSAILAQQRSQSDRYLRQMQDQEYQQALAAEAGAEHEEEEEVAAPLSFQEVDAVPDQMPSDPSPAPISTEKYEIRRALANESHSKLVEQIEQSPQDQLVKIALRLPNGSRVQQSFDRATNKVSDLLNFAKCHELMIDGKHIDEFELISSYPKKVIGDSQSHLTLEEAGIDQPMVLFCSVLDD